MQGIAVFDGYHIIVRLCQPTQQHGSATWVLRVPLAAMHDCSVPRACGRRKRVDIAAPVRETKIRKDYDVPIQTPDY